MNLEKKNAVVILGAGIMQVPAIRAAAEEGYSPLVFDGNPDPVGKNEAEKFFNIDIKDYDEIHRKCTELDCSYSVKGIFTAGTDFSYIVAKLAGKMGLPGISYETAVKATVKSEMRKAFTENNVSSPRFIVADSSFSIGNGTIDLEYPLVIKPVDSMGGRGSVKIRSVEKLEEAVKEAVGFSRSGRAIIEEYIEGAEFSLDAVVENNEITICGIADRHIFFPPYFVEMGHTMPSIYPSEVQEEIISVFKDGIQAIGINNGAAKGDIKYNGRKAVIGEIAARLSGGYMSGWTFPYSSGVSVIKAALNISLGKPAGLQQYRYDRTAAERAFLSIPGKVEKVILPDYLQNSSCPDEIKDIFINIEKGDRVVFPRNNVQKCGNIIAVHSERETAVAAAEKGCRDITVRLESCDAETEKFINGTADKWVPDAFRIENSSNIAVFSSMKNIILKNGYKNSLKTAVIPLPCPEKELSRDWLGRGFAESAEKVFEIAGAEYEKPGADYNAVLGELFWRAFLRGGVQGGIWIIDTVEEYLKRGELPDRFLQ